MFSACRHIKSDGIRCQSPAMRRSDFCYFHAKLHTSTRGAARRKLKFSAIEDTAGINTAVVQTLNALLTKSIDAKQAGLILYGIQIVAQKIDDHRRSPTDTVRSIIRSEHGGELAPELCIKDFPYGFGKEDCSNCGHRDTCRFLKSREDKNPEKKGDEADKATGVVTNLAAVNAEDRPSPSSDQPQVLALEDIKAATLQRTIDRMSPIVLLKTYLKLIPTGSPGS